MLTYKTTIITLIFKREKKSVFMNAFGQQQQQKWQNKVQKTDFYKNLTCHSQLLD